MRTHLLTVHAYTGKSALQYDDHQFIRLNAFSKVYCKPLESNVDSIPDKVHRECNSWTQDLPKNCHSSQEQWRRLKHRNWFSCADLSIGELVREDNTVDVEFQRLISHIFMLETHPNDQVSKSMQTISKL